MNKDHFIQWKRKIFFRLDISSLSFIFLYYLNKNIDTFIVFRQASVLLDSPIHSFFSLFPLIRIGFYLIIHGESLFDLCSTLILPYSFSYTSRFWHSHLHATVVFLFYVYPFFIFLPWGLLWFYWLFLLSESLFWTPFIHTFLWSIPQVLRFDESGKEP